MTIGARFEGCVW